MSDTPFLKRILLACSTGSARLFRNNTGMAWTGRATKITKPGSVHVSPGDVVIRGARPFHAGLMKGSGDLIGWRSYVIQPEDVGQRVAQFVSLEAKEGTGRLSAEQKAWRDQIQKAGGIAAEVRSVDAAAESLVGGLVRLEPGDLA